MAHIIVINKKYQAKLPENRGEVEAKQYERIAPYLSFQGSLALQVKVAIQLLYHQLPKKGKKVLLNGKLGDAAYDLSQLLSWMFPKPDQQVKSVLPWVDSFKHRRTTFFLPQKNFIDVSFGEWRQIDLYLTHISKIDYAKNPSDFELALLSLLAVIARPSKSKRKMKRENYDGWRRVPFNKSHIQRNRKKLKGCPQHLLFAALDACLQMRIFISQKYSVIFEGEGSEGGSFGLNGLALSIAESGVFGDARTVNQTAMNKVFIYAVKKRLDAIEMQRQIDNMHD